MRARSSSRAFTLVELIAVIALVAVFAGISSFAVLRMGSGSMDGAERLAGSQFNAARNLSLLKGTEVRVIIQNDPEAPEHFRRQLGIIYNVAEPTEPALWVAYDSGEVLPDGFYFVPEVARADGTLEPETMRLEFPRTDPSAGGAGTEYYYFEYNKAGIASPAGVQVVLEPGRPEFAADGFAIVPQGGSGETRKAGWGGFLILRLGGLLYFPDPNAIQGEG